MRQTQFTAAGVGGAKEEGLEVGEVVEAGLASTLLNLCSSP